MKEYVIRMLPLSSLEGNISSDTLFGALCWAIRTLYGEKRLEKLLDEFNADPPFLISSTFPFKIQDSQPRYFLPRPIYPPLNSEILNTFAEEEKGFVRMMPYYSPKVAMVHVAEKYKQFQNLKWISSEVFKLIANKGSEGEKNLFQEYLKNRLVGSVRKDEEGVQKNTLDRLMGSTGGAGNTFYNQETFLHKTFGLYFLLKTKDFTFTQPLLRLLQDSGIGANARTGKNHFKIVWEEKDFSIKSIGSDFVTLSRTIPTSNADFNRSYYELEAVRSKVESREEFAGEDVWKDTVTYLKEGSIITPIEPAVPIGGIYPVKLIQGKTIYQYGFAYPFWGNFSAEES